MLLVTTPKLNIGDDPYPAILFINSNSSIISPLSKLG